MCDLDINIPEFLSMTQIVIFIFWIFLPSAVLGIAITAILHYKSVRKSRKIFAQNETTQIQKLEKELANYKKAYNKLLCKYHSLQKNSTNPNSNSFVETYQHSSN